MVASIVIVCGFLGAGKTTLLRRVIDELDKKFAILMNEFGEVSVDGPVVSGKSINVVELDGGCVCCSLAGEFEAAIKEVVEKHGPELIIVETTGLAEPDGLVFELSEHLEEVVKLDSIITVADADALVKSPSVGHTMRVQLEMADVILLNKCDLVDKGVLEGLYRKLVTINGKALIVPTTRCDLDVNQLFGVVGQAVLRKEGHCRHEHGFESFTYDIDRSFDPDDLEDFLESLPKEVYRVKGFVDIGGKSWLVNFVAGRWELEEMASDVKQLVFIGEGLGGRKQDLVARLDLL